MSDKRDPRSFLASALMQYGYGHEVAEKLVQQALDEHAHELAEKIQADMEEIRAADWGKGSRSKRPYLQGMERAKKAIDPQKEGQ